MDESRDLWADRHVTTSADAVSAIDGVDKLIEYVGCWPDFDDAEIKSLILRRGNLGDVFETGEWSKHLPPSLTVEFMLSETLWAHQKGAIVTLAFHGAFTRLAIDGFNYQNPILGLTLDWEYSDALKKRLFLVAWGGTAMHHDVSFTCERIELVSVGGLR